MEPSYFLHASIILLLASKQQTATIIPPFNLKSKALALALALSLLVLTLVFQTVGGSGTSQVQVEPSTSISTTISVSDARTRPLSNHQQKHQHQHQHQQQADPQQEEDPMQSSPASSPRPKEKVCIVGSGNWASAIAIVIGGNTERLDFCHSDVNMYVYDEVVPVPLRLASKGATKTEKLSKIINTHHENVKYLPEIGLPRNIIAVPDLIEAIKGASLLIFCLPHQFLKPILHTIRDNYHLLHPSGCRGVSLIKGMDYDPISKSPVLISKSIQDTINDNNSNNNNNNNNNNNDDSFLCGVLMGANVANGVAKKNICESTLATNFHKDNQVPFLDQRTIQIFHTHQFRIQHNHDIYGTEACGALKNIIALGCGFVDSMYPKDQIDQGSNTKAALIRIGLLEMKRFCKLFLDDVQDETFWQSCGIADLITTCYSGRNYKCAKAFGYHRTKASSSSLSPSSLSPSSSSPSSPSLSLWSSEKCKQEWTSIEKELLNGQKLQGTLTCEEIYTILSSRNMLMYFPLINVIYEIAFLGKDIHKIVDGITTVDDKGINLDSVILSSIHHLRSKL